VVSDPHEEVVPGAGDGLGVQLVVVPGSLLVGVVVVVVSELGGAVVVVLAGVGEVVVVDGATAELLEFVPVIAPAVPAAATLGVVDWPSTVGAVCVWVRPGRTLGLAFGLVVALAACLSIVLLGVGLAVVAAFFTGAVLCGCLTGAG
jgi:hypothetical protein